jgi:hypothetical protein
MGGAALPSPHDAFLHPACRLPLARSLSFSRLIKKERDLARCVCRPQAGSRKESLSHSTCHTFQP